MSFFAPAFRALAGLEGPYPLTSKRLIDALGGGGPVAAGVNVSYESAMALSTVYACVRILAETLAALPLKVHEHLPDGNRQEADWHPLWRLLHDEPNPWMTSYQFRCALMGHVALRGNAYAEIQRNGAQVPQALWPLRPDRIDSIDQAASGALLYHYRTPDGDIRDIPQRNMLHIRGLTSDGVMGYSPVTVQRESLGLALAAQEFGARFFGQGARPGGVLITKKPLSEEAAQRLAHSWNTAHAGLASSHRVAVLEEGVEWQSVGMTQADAQFMLIRQFQTREIARMFRIPPHKIGDLEQATFSNIQIQGVEFVTDTMLPWVVNWEQELNRALFAPSERSRYYAAFNLDGIQRGDIKTRFETYAIAKQWGIYNSDEVRAFEGSNPIPDGRGETYYVPVNMAPAQTQEEMDAAAAAAAVAAPTPTQEAPA